MEEIPSVSKKWFGYLTEKIIPLSNKNAKKAGDSTLSMKIEHIYYENIMKNIYTIKKDSLYAYCAKYDSYSFRTSTPQVIRTDRTNKQTKKTNKLLLHAGPITHLGSQ